jgi:hypothetical protein
VDDSSDCDRPSKRCRRSNTHLQTPSGPAACFQTCTLASGPKERHHFLANALTRPSIPSLHSLWEDQPSCFRNDENYELLSRGHDIPELMSAGPAMPHGPAADRAARPLQWRAGAKRAQISVAACAAAASVGNAASEWLSQVEDWGRPAGGGDDWNCWPAATSSSSVNVMDSFHDDWHAW